MQQLNVLPSKSTRSEVPLEYTGAHSRPRIHTEHLWDAELDHDHGVPCENVLVIIHKFCKETGLL